MTSISIGGGVVGALAVVGAALSPIGWVVLIVGDVFLRKTIRR